MNSIDESCHDDGDESLKVCLMEDMMVAVSSNGT